MCYQQTQLHTYSTSLLDELVGSYFSDSREPVDYGLLTVTMSFGKGFWPWLQRGACSDFLWLSSVTLWSCCQPLFVFFKTSERGDEQKWSKVSLYYAWILICCTAIRHIRGKQTVNLKRKCETADERRGRLKERNKWKNKRKNNELQRRETIMRCSDEVALFSLVWENETVSFFFFMCGAIL